MGDYVDPEELPFTVIELFEAAKRFWPEENARRLAEHLGEVAPRLLEDRATRRADWKKRGHQDADSIPTYDWHLPPELFPALASLSPELSRRVAELRARYGPSYVNDVD
jgi:hypothetical protein